jgi:hypothetical protein
MKSLIKPKVAHWKGREPLGGIRKGMAVVMTDKWRGHVHQIIGDTVVCIQEGERPNDWLRGYRAFGRRFITIDGNKAIVDWMSKTAASRPTVKREQHQRDGLVVYLERARLERSWESAPQSN